MTSRDPDTGKFTEDQERRDQIMNKWIYDQVRGPNSKSARLARKLFGEPAKKGGKE